MRRRWPNSLKTLSYTDFVNVVTNGRKHVDAANDKVMPSFATNVNVMCFIDDIYVYLRARANDAIPGGRPPKHEDKPEDGQAGRDQLHGDQMMSGASGTRPAPASRVSRPAIMLTSLAAAARLRACRPAAGRGLRPGQPTRARSNSSIPTSFAPAAIRATCRSPTTRAKDSKTSLPNCSPPSSARSSATPISRRRPASCG